MNNIFGNSGYGGFGSYPYPTRTDNFAQTYGQTPYSNQVQQQQQMQMNPQPSGYVYFINGIEGAKAFMVQPNTRVILMDNDNDDKMYVKIANQQGQATIKYYELTEISPQNEPKKEIKAEPTNYATKEQLADLDTKYNEIEIKIDGIAKTFNDFISKFSNAPKGDK